MVTFVLPGGQPLGHNWWCCQFSLQQVTLSNVLICPNSLSRGDIIMPEGAKAGDVLLLTKALGTQVGLNSQHEPYRQRVKASLSCDQDMIRLL